MAEKQLRFYMRDVCDTGILQIAQMLLGKGSRYTGIVKLSELKRNVLYTGQVQELPEKKIRK